MQATEPRTSIALAQHDHRRATPEPAVGRATSTRGRAEQRGKRRQHDALRPSPCDSLPAFSGSDAMSDFMRRMERHASHGAKNEHAFGSAGSDVQRQPAVGRVTSTRGRAEQRGKRRQHEACRPSACDSLPASSGSDAMSDFMRRMERPACHEASNEHAFGSARSGVQRQSQLSAV